MQVTFVKELSDHVAVVWRVHDDRHCRNYAVQWSVKSGEWTVRGVPRGRVIPPSGKRGQQIIAAIEAHKGN